MVDLREMEDETLISSEQYKIWKKHVPFLYEIASTYEILTCTQTVEWLGETVIEDSVEYHYCIIGTNSIGTNKLYLLRIDLPLDNQIVDNS